MARPALFTRTANLIIAARTLHDRAGHPIVDLAGNRVLMPGAPLSLLIHRPSLFGSPSASGDAYGSGSYGSSTYG